MKIIIGLGNPEKQYDNTRHNTGFMTIDHYAKSKDIKLQSKSKFKASIAEFKLGEESVILVKPLTYYNHSGQAARLISEFYNIKLDNTLVIHDDKALPFGALRTRSQGSGGGNNGIKSINAYIGEGYARIRVGIANDLCNQMSDADFVLSRFSKVELDQLEDKILPAVFEMLDDFVIGRFESTSKKIEQ